MIRYLFLTVIFFLSSHAVVCQDDTVKVIGTMFVKKMLDGANKPGMDGQILMSDSLGILRYVNYESGFPKPLVVDSISKLDTLAHTRGKLVRVPNNGTFISDGDQWIRIECNINVRNVSELRKLQKSECPVYVQSYYDSLQYGGGYFHWIGYDKLGYGDDGGNIFAAKDTGFWLRDEIAYRPSNFGAVDSSDQKYSTFKSSTDAMQRCIRSAGKYGSIEFDQGFVYKNSGTLKLIEGQILNGNNASLCRIPRISSAIVSHQSGSDMVSVQNVEMFEIGTSVVAILNGVYSHSYTIVSKDSSGIRLSAAITALDNSQLSFMGGKLTTCFYQISAVQPNIKIDNLIINGNNSENGLYNRWENSGELYTSSINGKFTNLVISNSPGESICLFNDNPTLRNITIENSFGNGIHLGSNERYTIDNVSIINVNILARLGDFTLGHEGGGIAHSDDVHGGLVHNVYVEQALGVITGISSNDDSENYYDKISGQNCIKAIEIRQHLGASGLSDIQLTNSKFINCGILEISSNNQTTPVDFAHNIRVRNVELTNTSLAISNVFSISVDGLFFKDSSINTNLTFYNLENCVLRNINVQGGRYLSFANMNNVVLSNFDISNTYGNCAIHALYSDGDFLIENGKISHTECINGYRGIFAGRKSIIDNVVLRIAGASSSLPNSGIELYTSSTPPSAIVRNCVIHTPPGVPSIKAFYGTEYNYILNNIVNQPIQDNGTNHEVGTLLIDD
ncbi:MAG: hypothetical protein IPN29_03960 [Saprospiraceae bacterium]|nr:hypothetical protein [Saprospiraceae bacterium]